MEFHFRSLPFFNQQAKIYSRAVQSKEAEQIAQFIKNEALEASPFFGDISQYWAAFTGKTLFSGEKLSGWERALCAIPFAGKYGKKIKWVPKLSGKFNNFQRHVGRHLKEFGDITAKEYYKKAYNLMKGEVGVNVLEKFGKDGNTYYRYNTKTGDFGAIDVKTGNIKTFFRPYEGNLKKAEAYFNRQ